MGIAGDISSQCANESWEFSFAGASLGTRLDITKGASFAINNRFDVANLDQSVLNGQKSAIEKITINEYHQPGQEGFLYAFLEGDSAFSFDQLAHLSCAPQVDQFGFPGFLFHPGSLKSPGSSQTRWNKRTKLRSATNSGAAESQSAQSRRGARDRAWDTQDYASGPRDQMPWAG